LHRAHFLLHLYSFATFCWQTWLWLDDHEGMSMLAS
jgi:hypothetical protein